MAVRSGRLRVTAGVAVVLAALVLGTSCTRLTAGSSSAAGSPAIVAVAPTPELQHFYAQQLSWGPCVPFATTPDDQAPFADSRFDCTYVQVPLDYAQPGGRTAEIGVIRQQATDPAQRIGSLLTNPGGPGGSGMSSLPSIALGIGNGEVATRFDLIGFDPRGIGASKPGIDCLTPTQWDAMRSATQTDPSPAGVAGAEARNRDFAAACAQHSGVDVLANIGTREVAKDMDVLRAVLGDERLSYLGYSYGTRIGTEYAQAFPDKVRALVLDGAVDPDATAVDRAVGQASGFQHAFEAFASDCAQHADCPLGTDPAQASERYSALSRQLLDRPAPTADGRTLSFDDAQTGTIAALYSPQLWEPLRQGLGDLEAGDGTLLVRLADFYYGRTPDGGYDSSLDAFTAVHCVDGPRLTDPSEIAELNRKAAQAAPFMDSGRGATAARDACAFWPAPVSDEALHTPKGFAPVLVVSTTGDPATPYQNGIDLAKELGARLLTAEGDQHTATFGGTACVDDAVARYLVDLQLPADGLRCRITQAGSS